MADRLNARGRRKLATLKRRHEWLLQRIDASPKPLSWDLAEEAALAWAIDQMETT